MVQCPILLHISSFTVTYAYTWACIVKARVWSGEEGSENELEHFGFVADCRARLDPPLPENYFGNCLVPCLLSKEYSTNRWRWFYNCIQAYRRSNSRKAWKQGGSFERFTKIVLEFWTSKLRALGWSCWFTKVFSLWHRFWIGEITKEIIHRNRWNKVQITSWRQR